MTWINYLKHDCKCCNVLNSQNWWNWIWKIAIPEKALDMDDFQGQMA